MTRKLAAALAAIRKDLAAREGAQLLDPVPSGLIPEEHAAQLRGFAQKNEMYRGYYGATLGGIDCAVYEGNYDRYWLGTVRNRGHAPFSPTWLASAYACAATAKGLGYGELVDIGSGDGRIAFCGGLLGMRAYAIELDPQLADLAVSSGLGRRSSICADATALDYGQLGLSRPIFFVGGLAQMGGAALASGVMDRLKGSCLDPGWAFAGTVSPKYAADPMGHAGWGTLLGERGLEVVRTVSLPAAWTLREPDMTPYVFAKRKPN